MKNPYSYNPYFVPQSSTQPMIWDMGSPPSNGGMNLGLILHGGVVYNDPGNAEPSSTPDPEDPPSEPESEPPSSPSYPPIPDESDDEPSTPAKPSNIELKLALLQQILNNNSGFNTGLPVNEPLNLTFQPVNYNPAGSQTPVAYQQINVSNPQPIGQELATRVAQRQAQANQIAVQQTHQQVSHILDQLALSQGLPTYKEFHAQNGIPYPAPPNPGTLGIAQIQNQNSSNPWIQEDQYQIQANLQHAQTPLQLDAWQARLQTAQQQAAQDQANLLAEFKRQPTNQQQKSSVPSNTKAQVKSRSAWQNLQAGIVLGDSELKQVFHDLDLRYYGATTEQDKQQAELLRLYTAQKQAENMVTHAERDKDDNVVLSGVPMRKEDALHFAKLDVQHFEQTDIHLKPEQLITRNHSTYSSGTRPNNENPSAYQMLERANDSLRKIGQTEHDRELLWAKGEAERKSAEALQQQMRNLYSYNELKVHYGMDPEAAAWQLGFKKTLNEFLYGLHNFLEGAKDSPNKPNYKNPLPYNSYDLSLEAHFPNRTQMGSMAANSIINKQIKNLLPAYKNKPFIEKWVKEQVRGQIITAGTKAIKARSSKKNE